MPNLLMKTPESGGGHFLITCFRHLQHTVRIIFRCVVIHKMLIYTRSTSIEVHIDRDPLRHCARLELALDIGRIYRKDPLLKAVYAPPPQSLNSLQPIDRGPLRYCVRLESALNIGRIY